MSLYNFLYSSSGNLLNQLFKLKDKVDELIDRYENQPPTKNELKGLIKTKNVLISTLTQINNSLKTIQSSTEPISNVISVVSGVLTLIKTLPTPTSVPPGIGLPLNIITALADKLGFLKDELSKGKGILDAFPKIFDATINIIDEAVEKLQLLDSIINKYIKDYDDDELRELVEESVDIPIDNNILGGENLEDRLKLNAIEPLIYKGFTLNLEYDKENTLSISSKRIRGFNKTTKQTLYNDDYSFSTSIDVLIDEIKFKIDSL